MIGRGHGFTYLKLLAERLGAEGAPVVAIDPDVDDLRARRAYEKAGFFDVLPNEQDTKFGHLAPNVRQRRYRVCGD
jgi:RimJ/RimL family protein N-acetyltransferase